MIKIAICDDDAAACTHALACTKDLVAARFPAEELEASQFCNPVDLLDAIEHGQRFDLVLCDIYMPGLLGTQAFQELRDKKDTTRVVFVTSSRDHAVDAMALHAEGYLQKPFDSAAFADAVAPVVERIIQERTECVELKSRTGDVLVRYADIAYCQTNGHDQELHLLDGRVVVVRMSSQALFELLQGDARFFKAGSSYILNLDAIRSVLDAQVELIDNMGSLRVPARMHHKLCDAFFERMMSKVG